MDQTPEDVIRRELGPGEELLWAGRPRRGFVLRASDVFVIPFSLMWGGFAIFWEATVILSDAPWFFTLWGVPFVLVGLYVMVGRFWTDARQREKTLFAVTSERVVIISGMFSRQVKSLSIDTLSDVTLTESADGSGVITFGPLPPWHGWYGGAYGQGFGQQSVPSFELAQEARRVYETVRAAQRAAKQRC